MMDVGSPVGQCLVITLDLERRLFQRPDEVDAYGFEKINRLGRVLRQQPTQIGIAGDALPIGDLFQFFVVELRRILDSGCTLNACPCRHHEPDREPGRAAENSILFNQYHARAESSGFRSCGKGCATSAHDDDVRRIVSCGAPCLRQSIHDLIASSEIYCADVIGLWHT